MGTAPPCVLITGGSTGIGRAASFWLAARNWRVFAGVRRQADAESIRDQAARPGVPVEPVIIDVVDDASIAAAAADIRSRLAGAPLLGLVNNAGIGVAGPIEFVARDEWRRQFDVNLFGQVAVTQAFLPLLREGVAQRGPGAPRIVFIGSIAGIVSQPILCPYCASKHAVRALADALRVEVASQGIHVCLVAPGAIDTPIWGKGHKRVDEFGPDHPAMARYGDTIRGVIRAAGRAAERAISADHTSRAIEACLTARRPRAHTLVGRDARLTALVKRWLPTRRFDAILAKKMGVSLVPPSRP